MLRFVGLSQGTGFDQNSPMRILLVGSGAREHAMARALVTSPGKPSLIAFGSTVNPGIEILSSSYETGSMKDPEPIAAFARDERAELAVIGPEAPLAAGCVDLLTEAGIPCFGPTQAHARIESSKAYARDLLEAHGIKGSPRYRAFRDLEGTEDFLRSLGENFVIKADGLMGGKGVKVSGDHLAGHSEAIAYMQELAEAGSSFVIEEKCVGPEFSLISVTDGLRLVHFPAVQDHKRAFEGDTGPNTGGMGSYSDANHSLPFLETSDIVAARRMNEATVRALGEDNGSPYRGVLYGGFMATADGVRLIEYNARFGDPECMNLLSVLQGDFAELVAGCARGETTGVEVRFEPLATVCKYAVPEGYPDRPLKDFPIDLTGVAEPDQLFLGSVDQKNGKLLGAGSRTVAVVGKGLTLREAERKAEAEISKIRGPLFHRKDIGTESLIESRIQLIRNLRGSDH